jgi:hypothetical protein
MVSQGTQLSSHLCIQPDIWRCGRRACQYQFVNQDVSGYQGLDSDQRLTILCRFGQYGYLGAKPIHRRFSRFDNHWTLVAHFPR